jgi:Na+:H+ antiporter, NhaA family
MKDLGRSPLPRRPLLPADVLVRGRVTGGLTFLVGALIAFLWANTTHGAAYLALRGTGVTVALGAFRLTTDLRSFVNDGLMTLFIFSIGLAARRQMDSLRDGGRAPVLVPCAAAAGALLVPAVILRVFGAAPSARLALAVGGFDIGLALAAFAVVQAGHPAARHPLFLFSVALDAGWIAAMITLSLGAVSWAGVALCILVYGAAFMARMAGARGAAWGLLSGVAVWFAWRRAGLPPALAGALLATLVPGRGAADERVATELAEGTIDDFDRAMDESDAERCSALARRLGDIGASAEVPMDRWQAGVLPWLTWLALPLFGWVNGGIVMAPLSPRAAAGLVLALLVGRPLGTLAFGWFARRRAALDVYEPDNRRDLAALACVVCAGGAPALIGTVIALPPSPERDVVALGVLGVLGLSLCAAVAGGLLLRWTARSEN